MSVVETEVDTQIERVLGKGLPGNILMLILCLLTTTLMRLLLFKSGDHAHSNELLACVANEDCRYLPLTRLISEYVNSQSWLVTGSNNIFAVRAIIDSLVNMPLIMHLLTRLHIRASFKLRLLHLCAISAVISPLVLFSKITSLFAFSCILVTWSLLLLNFPLLASLTFVTALNLDVTMCLPLTLVFIVQAIGGIVVNSPSAYIMKQVDHIVWKVIFLCLNCIIVNAAIWWPYITNTTVISSKETSTDDETPMKLSFDFKQAKQIITEHLLNVNLVHTRFNLSFGFQLGFVLLTCIPALYLLAKETGEAR